MWHGTLIGTSQDGMPLNNQSTTEYAPNYGQQVGMHQDIP